MNIDINNCLKEYGKLSDKSLDWYFISVNEEDKWKRLIARIKYYSLVDERKKIARRMNNLCQNLTK